MTLVELRKSIHERIDNVNNPHTLEMVNALLFESDELFIIPEEHKKDREQGIQDIKNGDFITLDEFEKRYEKWLKD